jgi:hypothetical protein
LCLASLLGFALCLMMLMRKWCCLFHLVHGFVSLTLVLFVVAVDVVVLESGGIQVWSASALL